MAIIGLGEIGLAVAERASAFGIQVVAMHKAEFLAQLPDNAIVINTSRGNVIDDNAMLEVLNHRGFRLGADVWNNEPKAKSGEFASPLAQHRSVVGSHHATRSSAPSGTSP